MWVWSVGVECGCGVWSVGVECGCGVLKTVIVLLFSNFHLKRSSTYKM